MRQKLGRAIQPIALSSRNSHAELFCIPIDDDGGQQVQTRNTEVLAVSGAIADFTLSADPQSTFQGMIRFTFV